MKAGIHALGILLLMTLIVAAMCTTAIAAEPEFDASTSITQLESLANGGNAAAMLEYGERLVQGQGVDTNTAQGLSWLQKAADAGKSEAWYDIGFVYSNGVGVELDLPKAVTYYRKGAEAGNADCQASMGLLYQAGDKVPSGLTADPAEAVKWYRLASDQNHTEAIQHLAMMNAMGKGIKQDNAEAARLFRQGAELGNADCTWGLGQCYLSGKGVQPDTVMAYALFSASLDGVENPEQKKAMTEQCDKLGKALTAVQLKMAEPLIQEWKTKGRVAKQQ